MANLMLECVPPAELANRGQVIEITNKISDFSRLSEIIVEDLGEASAAEIPSKWRQAPVDIKLRFGWEETHPGIPALEGGVTAQVALVCQRCLNPFELELDVGLKLLLPRTSESPTEHEGFEVWEFDENDVRPADIVEEALIMALPFSALHESSDDCTAISVDEKPDDSRKTRPFEDLQSLMAQANEIDD
jgi:uncharacterized protein